MQELLDEIFSFLFLFDIKIIKIIYMNQIKLYQNYVNKNSGLIFKNLFCRTAH